MSLLTIPSKYYDQLLLKIEDKKTIFNWNELSKNEESYEKIKDYVLTTTCKFIGEGSSRQAFLLPETTDCKDPCCFKVAKNEKGIAQNKAEYGLFKKYNNMNCFPHLIRYDDKNNFYILTEIGREFDCDDRDVNYFFTFLKTIKWSKNASDAMKYLPLNYRNCRFIEDVLSVFIRFIEDLIYEIDDKKESATDAIKYIKDAFVGFPGATKYNTLISLIEFALNGGYNDVVFIDFESAENWAYVKRDKYMQAIPIDFGYTPEVKNKYY